MRTVVLVPLALLACTSSTEQTPPATRSTPTRIASKSMFPPAEAMVGISGLTRHPSGRYFAVSERERSLFPISIEASGRATVGAPIPIIGVPDGMDIEAAAFLDENTIAFGTESQDEARTADAILYGAFTEERVKVLDERSRAFFDYRAYGFRPDPNRGVEGLCAIDAKLIAAGEQVVEKDGLRIAPLQVYDPLVRGWQAHELVLTSKDGKISALTCLAGAARTEVFAIERHYSTVRIVRFDVPLAANKMVRVRAELVADLAPLLGAKPKNYEGLAFAATGGGLIVINDNSYGSLDGPTELLHLVDLEGARTRWGGAVR